jgi:hypothetical protein
MRWIVLIVPAVVSWSVAAPADPIDLNLPSFPRVEAVSFDVVFTLEKEGGNLVAVGEPTLFVENEESSIAIVNGTYELELPLSSNGGVLDIGSMCLDGALDQSPGVSETLLAGDIVAFGFPNAGGDPLEFLISVTGGVLCEFLCDDFEGTHGLVGILLNGTEFPGSFASSWDNLVDGKPGTGEGTAATAPPVMPVPVADLTWGKIKGLYR